MAQIKTAMDSVKHTAEAAGIPGPSSGPSCSCPVTPLGGGSVRRLDTAYFEQTIKALADANDNFANSRKNIVSRTKELLDCWEGDGRARFGEIFWRLKRELDDEEELLAAMKKDLEGILETYQSWDQSMASAISGNEAN